MENKKYARNIIKYIIQNIMKNDIDFENILNQQFSIVSEQKIMLNHPMFKKKVSNHIFKTND